MSRRLIIIGAGNVGGFLSYNASEVGNFEVLGFLDDDCQKIGKQVHGRSVLGTVDDLEKYIGNDELNVAVCISAPKVRLNIVERIKDLPIVFPNIVGRNVWVSENVNIGKGVILYPGVSINYGCHIGDFVIMNMNCAIGHDCRISPYSSLAPGVNLAGFSFLEEGADLGIGVSTRQNIRIGRFSKVGGQSMVVTDVPPETLTVGVPGRTIKKIV